MLRKAYKLQNRKLWGIFSLSILFIVLYCIFVPRKEGAWYKYYTYGIFAILYTAVIFFSVCNIRLQELEKKEWITAIVLGISGSLVAPNWAGILSGVCTMPAYLYCVCQNRKYGRNTKITKEHTKEYLIDDLKIIFIGLVIYVVVLWFGLFVQGRLRQGIVIGFPVFRSAVGAGVSEEIIFRWFLLTFLRQMNHGNEIDDVLYYAMVLIPFALLHVIDIVVSQGLNAVVLGSLISVLLQGLPLAILVRKRDVFTAMCLHCIFDFIK